MANDSATGWNGPIISVVPLASAEPLALLRAAGSPLEVKLRGPRALLDQKDLKCCVSCALAACLEVLHAGYAQLSALFHYAMTVAPNPQDAVDLTNGMTPEEGFAALYHQGICSFEKHPYPFRSPEAKTKPNQAAIDDALPRAVTELDFATYLPYFQPIGLAIDPVNECKKCLQQGNPLLFGIYLTANWGAAKLDSPGARTGSRHAVACLGYSDLEASFIIQDSFGPGHGRGGQWWLPYQSFVSSEPIVFSAHAVGYNLGRS